jgi:hypothetical protein
VNKLKGIAMETKNEYINCLETELREWSAKSDLLAAKAEKSIGIMMLGYREQLKTFRAKLREAKEKMTEIEKTSDEACEMVKETADKDWDELRAGLNVSASEFSNLTE